MRPGYSDIRSFLPLSVCVYFHTHYSAAFTVLQLLIFIYKGVMLPYPSSAIGLEVAFVCVYALIQAARLWMTSKGNKTELVQPLVYALVLAAPVIVFHVYMLRLQTYVLRLDQIINGIGIAFVGLEVFFTIIAIVTFVRSHRF